MKKKIAIFCGGPSSEYEISLSSAKAIYKHLDKNAYNIAICFITKDLHAKLIKNGNLDFENDKTNTPLLTILKQIKKEGYLAFLAGMHGEFGEDGKLQALLEFEGIPYSGSNEEASALCTDKMRSMILANSINIKIPNSVFLNIPSELDSEFDITFPAILKPNNLGSSVGLSIINSREELKKEALNLIKKFHTTQILVQEYIYGLEVSCGALQNKQGKFTLLPPIEIHPNKSVLFDYSSKYSRGGSLEITPPKNIDTKTANIISEIATKLHIILGCKTYSRSDFIVKGKMVYYLETNTLPGMTDTSLIPQEAEAAGIPFSSLLDFLIQNSL